jgi:hypothetical protein
MEPSTIIDQWVQAVNNRNLDEILGFYAENAILIPTFSDKVSNSKEKIKKYFENLLEKKNLAVQIHPTALKEQTIQNGMSVLSGIYRWQFEVEEEVISYEARFSFVIDCNSGNPILHHHSSQIPRML